MRLRCVRVFVCVLREHETRGNCIAGARNGLAQAHATREKSYPKFWKNAIYYCTDQKLAVPLQRKSKIHPVMLRTPECYIADIELLTGKSYRTAQRVLVKVRKHFGLSSRQRPTFEQVEQYLVHIK